MNSPTRSRRAVTDPPPLRLVALGARHQGTNAQQFDHLQYAVCQPVLRRPVWPFRTLHIEHIQRIMTFRMPTSAGQRADGKTVGSEVWEQRRDTPGKVKEHIQSGWCRHLRKSIVHIVRNRAQKPCLSLCTRSASIATKTRLHTTVRAQATMLQADSNRHHLRRQLRHHLCDDIFDYEVQLLWRITTQVSSPSSLYPRGQKLVSSAYSRSRR